MESDSTQNANSLRQLLKQPHKEASLLFSTSLLVLVIELIAITVVPMVIPDHIYLRAYLNDIAERNTEEILTDTDQFLIYDDVTGWRNRPNSGKGKWSIDQYGSRTNHPFTVEPSKPLRVLFLGSSLVNGGVNIIADQTASDQ